jgi:hypothetical protein
MTASGMSVGSARGASVENAEAIAGIIAAAILGPVDGIYGLGRAAQPA